MYRVWVKGVWHGAIATIILAGILVVVEKGGSFWVALVLSAIGMMPICIAFELITAKEEKKNREERELEVEMEQYATCTNCEHKTVLLLKRRSSKFSKAIKIYDDKDAIIDYEPVRYIFTSATVGRITTGGIDKVGGNTYLAGTLENGKCRFEYLKRRIDAIQLTDELYEEAKKSKISKYLNDKKQIVIDTGYDPALAVAIDMYDMSSPTGSLTLQALAKSGYPTRKKCIEIIDWLCVE